MFRRNTARVDRETLELVDKVLAGLERSLELDIESKNARKAATATKQRTRPPRPRSKAGIEERLDALERKVADLETWRKKSERGRA